MTERFIEWKPLAVTGLIQQSLRDDRNGLTIILESSEQEARIECGIVVAFRSVLEEACSSYWERFHEGDVRGSALWIVEGSTWLASFDETDLIHYPGTRHYLVLTEEERIDVLTAREPTVTFRPKK